MGRASSGDTILLRGGVYHETVQIYRKALTIASAPGERAVLDGARPVDGFVASGGDWYAGGWTTQFYRTTGDMVGDDPTAAYPDEVFLDGAPLRQVLRREDVVPGTFFHDTAADRIWLGDDPGGRLVEASARSWALYFNEAHGSRLRDVTVRRYATQGRDMAAIRLYSNDLVVAGVVSELNAFSGISAIGSNIVIRDSRMSENGYIGLHGDRLSTLVVEDSSLVANNRAGFDPFHSAAGLKVTSSTGITVRNSDVSLNDGPGIWTDIYSSNVTVACNLTQRNGRSGIEVELTSRANVLGNVSLANGEAGVWVLESRDVQVRHNATFDNEREIAVTEGPRQDVQNVGISGNLLGRSQPAGRSMLSVEDWTEERSAALMNVTADRNTFWRANSTANLSRWARWPQAQAFSATLAAHRSSTGQGAASVEAATMPVRDAGAFDYRAPDGAMLGDPLSTSMASVFGVAPGSRVAVGPSVQTPPLGASVPAGEQTGPIGGSASPDGHRHAVRLGVILHGAGNGC